MEKSAAYAKISVGIVKIASNDLESTGSLLAVSEFTYAAGKLAGIASLYAVDEPAFQLIGLFRRKGFLDQIE